ncbi:hypothetical protein [Cellulomonas sp. NPDC089187]|uniref:hypothetical protein n=1 Tax=Cellulomonas sp. NPDC089187 TaxID=3154970 RepID=UPI00343A7384
MTADTPRHARAGTPWWRRVGGTLRRVLALEPVAVQAVLRAVFVLAAAVGLTVSQEVQSRMLAVVAAVYALVEAATTAWARSRVSPVPPDGQA